MPRPLLTLTTDFGHSDPFAGTMKGVIYSIFREVEIADITHGIAAFDLLGGALAIAQAAKYYPAGTVHVVVVDPGVGSSRRPIVATADNQVFVAPDNGVLTLIFDQAKNFSVRHMANAEYFLEPVSQTFHGRDIFAAAAAHLASGIPQERFGPEISDYVRLSIPRPERIAPDTVRGQILKTDRFGNLLTNLRPEDIPMRFSMRCGSYEIKRLVTNYQEGAPGELFLIAGSSGLMEICSNRASAAELLGSGWKDVVVRDYS